MENTKQIKIFLVDDDLFSLNLYRQHIINLGYHDVATFENGTDCLDHLTQNPDVVFLDHNMDIMTGYEVLRKIKRYNPNIYVVMVSAQENMKTAVNSLKSGAFDYIIKGDQETVKMENVLQRIIGIQEMLNASKPSVLRKILSII